MEDGADVALELHVLVVVRNGGVLVETEGVQAHEVLGTAPARLPRHPLFRLPLHVRRKGPRHVNDAHAVLPEEIAMARTEQGGVLVRHHHHNVDRGVELRGNLVGLCLHSLDEGQPRPSWPSNLCQHKGILTSRRRRGSTSVHIQTGHWLFPVVAAGGAAGCTCGELASAFTKFDANRWVREQAHSCSCCRPKQATIAHGPRAEER
mmetsp:Transcript_103856/g.293725  ORF Transcript_103856/g.293725 Transcript_103856/m.293725 type:complete len:206 (-) Transcript_103856:34-651(-)